jgi:hypothetical protein
MDVPTFLDRVSGSDLTFFDPGDVVDLLAAHGCGDQFGSYLRRLSAGLRSTGTVRTDGAAIAAHARRSLTGEAGKSHTVAVELAEALTRAGCTDLLVESPSEPGRRRRSARLFGPPSLLSRVPWTADSADTTGERADSIEKKELNSHRTPTWRHGDGLKLATRSSSLETVGSAATGPATTAQHPIEVVDHGACTSRAAAACRQSAAAVSRGLGIHTRRRGQGARVRPFKDQQDRDRPAGHSRQGAA